MLTTDFIGKSELILNNINSLIDGLKNEYQLVLETTPEEMVSAEVDSAANVLETIVRAALEDVINHNDTVFHRLNKTGKKEKRDQIASWMGDYILQMLSMLNKCANRLNRGCGLLSKVVTSRVEEKEEEGRGAPYTGS